MLTVADVLALNVIVTAAAQKRRVRWLDGDDVAEGVARNIGTATGALLHDDVRDGFLRVTTLQGSERFVPVRDLVPLVKEGGFAVD